MPAEAPPPGGRATDDADPLPGWHIAIGAAFVGAIPLVMSLGLGLNGDVQYMIGGLNVAGDGIGGFVETFIHRPLAYRFVIATVMDIVGATGIRVTDQELFEVGVRLVGLALCAGLAAGLWRTLRDRIGNAEAAAVGAAVGLTLAIGPTWDFLQAEWVGVYLAALGLVAALGPARVGLAAVLSGLCITLAVAVKLATAPIAVIALVALALVDRRRALPVIIGTAAWGGLWLASLLAMPIERTWLRDMAALNANSPLRVGVRWSEAATWWEAIVGRTLMLPVIVLAPAAVVLLTRVATSAVSRALVAAGLVLAVILAIAPLPAQGETYPYHLAALPVVSAGIVAAALARWWRVTARPPIIPMAALLLLAAGGLYALGRPPEWRAAHADQVQRVVVVVAVSLAAWAAVARRSPGLPSVPTQRVGTALAAASVLALVPALAPGTAFSFDPVRSPYTNASWQETSRVMHGALRELSSLVGPETDVLYLTYGAIGYHMANPTECRYPSPAWLKVSIRDPSIKQFASYRDNVACLSSPTPRYLILQPGWLDIDGLDPAVRQILEQRYDCAAALESRGYLACPRR